MEALKTNAIILKRRVHKEFHGSISVFSKASGKMHLTAMGLYKPASKLSPFLIAGNLVYLTLSKGRGWHITGAKIITPFSSLLFEPRLLYLSSIVLELLQTIFPTEEKHEDIFEKAVDCLTMLTSKKLSITAKELVIYRFILAVFSTQGLLPDFSRCSKDRKLFLENEPRYWKIERGLLCSTCKEKEKGASISLPSSITRIADYTTGDELSKEERGAITTMVQDIYSHEHHAPLVSLLSWTESL